MEPRIALIPRINQSATTKSHSNAAPEDSVKRIINFRQFGTSVLSVPIRGKKSSLEPLKNPKK